MSTHLEIHIPNDRDRLYRVIKYPAGEIQVRLTDEGLLAGLYNAGRGYNNGKPKEVLE